MEAQGVRAPRDIRVVGFDDVKYATLFSVPLTTIHQPCRDIAVIAFRTMLERVAEPTLPARSIALTPRLVVRESCGAYLPRPRLEVAPKGPAHSPGGGKRPGGNRQIPHPESNIQRPGSK
jgi:hypothetical protein